MTKKFYPKVTIYHEFGIQTADFYNIDLANDNQVFLDPYEIGRLSHPVALKATKTMVEFFEFIRQLLFSGNIKQAKELFCNHLVEPRETCLGYASIGVHGRGLKDMAEYALEMMFADSATLTRVIKHIEDIKLFVPSISHDRVSDIFTNVVRKCLIDYTAEQCTLYGQTLIEHTTNPYWDVETHAWKISKEKCYIWHVDNEQKILVPKCFITGSRYNTSRFISSTTIPSFIAKELNKGDSPLIYKLKDGTPKITKKAMRDDLIRRGYSMDKKFATHYALQNPDCIDAFRDTLSKHKKR